MPLRYEVKNIFSIFLYIKKKYYLCSNELNINRK